MAKDHIVNHGGHWINFRVPEAIRTTLDGIATGDEITIAVSRLGNTLPEGNPGITGTPEVGETLTATTSDISDVDGTTGAVFTYQWKRGQVGGSDEDAVDIPGATGQTYTVISDDIGQEVWVVVTFTDDRGAMESIPSNTRMAIATPVIGPVGQDREDQQEDGQQDQTPVKGSQQEVNPNQGTRNQGNPPVENTNGESRGSGSRNGGATQNTATGSETESGWTTDSQTSDRDSRDDAPGTAYESQRVTGTQVTETEDPAGETAPSQPTGLGDNPEPGATAEAPAPESSAPEAHIADTVARESAAKEPAASVGDPAKVEQPPQPAPQAALVEARTPYPAAQPAPGPESREVGAADTTPAPSAPVAPVPAAEPLKADATPSPFLITPYTLALHGPLATGINESALQPDQTTEASANAPGQVPERAAWPEGTDQASPQQRLSSESEVARSEDQVASAESGRRTPIWAVMAVYAAIVLCSGFGYYRLRMRRRWSR